MPGITIRFITIALKPVAFSLDKISLKKLSESSVFNCRMPYLKENTYLLLATFISFLRIGVLGIFAYYFDCQLYKCLKSSVKMSFQVKTWISRSKFKN